MRAIASAAILALLLSACDALTGALETAKESMVQARGVSEDLDKALGVRPAVSVNWKNGELAAVTLSFKEAPKDVRIAELAEQARASVGKRFSTQPKELVIAFSLSR